MKGTQISVVVYLGFLVMAVVPSSAQAQVSANERAALIDLYESTNGSMWAYRDNWRNGGDTDFNAPGTECTWYGVTCDATENHVLAIDLGDNNLSGEIPDSIAAFSWLEILYLSMNPSLTSEIPAAIGSLAALRSLDAYDGGFTGTIPDEIGDLSNLELLVLDENNLSGPIPGTIGNLSNLEYLSANGNDLTSLPPEITQLSRLETMYLSDNQLAGEMPTAIGDLASLRYLDLAYNQLTGDIPQSIGDLTELRELNLNRNNLQFLPSTIENLSALTYLYLSDNPFHVSLPSFLTRITSLKYLDLSKCGFTGSLPPEVGDLRQLRRLDLSGNLLTGSVPEEIVKLASLGDGYGLDIRWNGIHSDSRAVAAFLAEKHDSSIDWRATQTVPPPNVSIGEITDTSVELRWDPIPYTGDTGGYIISYATSSGGDYQPYGPIFDKTVDRATVPGLFAGTTYFFLVSTITLAHSRNPFAIASLPSLEVSAKTAMATGSPALSIGDATIVEGDSGTVSATFTVSLFPSSAEVVTLDVVTAAGTASSGSDFVAASMPVTIPSGEITQTVQVQVKGDTLVEGDETFFAILSGISGAGVADGSATGLIVDDDTGLVAHERQALIDLFNGTNGSGWSLRTNWRNAGDTDFNAPGTECTWYGITCDPTGQRVTTINLQYNDLDGSLPNSIGDFTALEWMNLSGNDQLEGAIPASIGRLAALKKLEAYDGSFTGPLPAEIGDLSNLTHLWLPGNSLSGPLPTEIGQLSALKYLDLGWNDLSGSIPPEIGDLTALISLSFDYNQLSGSLPSDIGDLSNLSSLYLNHNQLSGQISERIGALSNLIILGLSDNQLSGPIPPEIWTLSNLYALGLQGNQLTGAIPPEVGNLSDLGSLNLARNRLTGPIPAEITNLSALRRLSLEFNQLNGPIPPGLDNLGILWDLKLSGNRLSGLIPSEIGDLASLRQLWLNDNELSGPIPPEIGNLANLTDLHLSANKLVGELPSSLSALSSLQDMWGLDIRWNGLHTDSVYLAALLNLKHSDFGDWRATQTVAPDNLVVASVSDHTVWLSWNVIDFATGSGGYEVYSSPTGTEQWISGGWTADKLVTMFPVTGLDSGITYDFAVLSISNPHSENRNTVVSDLSGVETAATADIGCVEPVIAVDFNGAITLSVVGDFTTFDWSTGETTSEIVVDPEGPTWYWVAVTSAGGCGDTASTLVDPPVFVDGFESGDTSVWSSVVP